MELTSDEIDVLLAAATDPDDRAAGIGSRYERLTPEQLVSASESLVEKGLLTWQSGSLEGRDEWGRLSATPLGKETSDRLLRSGESSE
jgi:hypothetical protein